MAAHALPPTLVCKQYDEEDFLQPNMLGVFLFLFVFVCSELSKMQNRYKKSIFFIPTSGSPVSLFFLFLASQDALEVMYVSELLTE